MRRAAATLPFVSGLLALALSAAPRPALAGDKPQAKFEIIEEEPARPAKAAAKPPEKAPAKEEPKAEAARPPEQTKTASLVAGGQPGKPAGAGGDVGPKPSASMQIEEGPAPASEGPPPTPVGEEKAAIADFIRGQTRDVVDCYQRRLEYRPTLQGKLYVIFYIGPNGRVIGATSQGIEDSDLAACILKFVRKWEFDKPRSGGKLMVKYPFVLRPEARR